MKRLLTKKFVNEVMPPEQGEVWIADTKVRKFGLRLWATKSGGGKAFCVRVGPSLRLTYDPYQSILFRNRIWFEDEFKLGAFLSDARNWAEEELAVLRNTADDELHWEAESHENRDYFHQHVKQLTLEQAAVSLLNGMHLSGRSDQYVDQLNKLFHQWEGDELKQKPLDEISIKELARSLVDRKYSWGNIRALQTFIGQVNKQAREFGAGRWKFSEKLGREVRKQIRNKYGVKYPELINLDPAVHEELFKKLEENEEQWQQAYCIRLFFEFRSPLSRIMAARWCEIYEDHWYPYAPDDRSFWFEVREHITDPAKLLLDKIQFHISKEFGESNYWFPSAIARSVPHITTVNRLWRKTVKELGFEGVPLSIFVLTKKERNNPSYYGSFWRQYKTIWRELENVAELSKKVTALRKK